jgi:hypothetical protein
MRLKVRAVALRGSLCSHLRVTVDINHSRDASAPELCQQPRKIRIPSQKTEGSGAPKGASNHCPRIADKSTQSAQNQSARGSAPKSGRARLPALHCGTRQRSRNRLWLSSRTTFPGTRLGRVFCPPRACPVQRAPRRPVLLPAKWCPEAARVRGANPPAGTALAPISGVPSRRRRVASSNIIGDNNQLLCHVFSDAAPGMQRLQ